MTEKDDIARIVSRNSLYSALYNFWYLGSRLLLTPLILSFVGIDQYGLWSYCFVVLSYLSLTAFGFNSTYIRYAADYRSRNENEKLNELLSTGLLTMLALSIAVFPLFVLLIPRLLVLLGIDAGLHATARGLLLGTAAIFFLNFCLAGYQNILEGEQRIALVRKIHFAASVVEIILIIVLFYAGWGVFALLWAYAARFALVIACCVFFAYRVFPFLKLRISLFRKASLKQFLGFGNQMNLLGLLSLVINSADRIWIARLLNLEAVGIYEVGRKLPNIGLMLPSSMAGTLMPAASHLTGSAQNERLRHVYLSSTRYLMLLSTLPYVMLVFFARQIIEVWVGPGFEQAHTVMQLLALGTFVNLLTGIGTACVRGMGKPGYEIEYMAISVALILGLLPVALPRMGLTGAAWAYCIGQVIGSLYFLWRTRALFSVSGIEFARKVLPPVAAIFLCVLPALALCRWVWPTPMTSRWTGLCWLILIGTAYLVTVVLILLTCKRRLLSADEIRWLSVLPLPRALRPAWSRLWGV